MTMWFKRKDRENKLDHLKQFEEVGKDQFYNLQAVIHCCLVNKPYHFINCISSAKNSGNISNNSAFSSSNNA